MQNIVCMGRVGASYGLAGWNHIHALGEDPQALLAYKRWFLRQGHGSYHDAKLESVRAHGGKLIAKFQGTQDKEQASLHAGLWIGIAREDFPSLPEGQYYWSDLLGMDVYDKGQKLGSVASMYQVGTSDVMVVQGEVEYQIPFVQPTFVVQVALQEARIEVDWL